MTRRHRLQNQQFREASVRLHDIWLPCNQGKAPFGGSFRHRRPAEDYLSTPHGPVIPADLIAM